MPSFFSSLLPFLPSFFLPIYTEGFLWAKYFTSALSFSPLGKVGPMPMPMLYLKKLKQRPNPCP